MSRSSPEAWRVRKCRAGPRCSATRYESTPWYRGERGKQEARRHGAHRSSDPGPFVLDVELADLLAERVRGIGEFFPAAVTPLRGIPFVRRAAPRGPSPGGPHDLRAPAVPHPSRSARQVGQVHGGGDHPVPGEDGHGDPRQLRRRGGRERVRLDPPVRERAGAQAPLRSRLPERLLEERDLAEVGAHVVVCSRRAEALEPVATAVRAEGRRALAVACDVGDARQVDHAVARTVETFGRIDILVNNAGYRIRSPLEDLPRSEWDAMVATNLTGVFLFAQAAGRVMIRQRAGKIINVTSVAGRSGSRGMAAYAAAKAGAAVLTQSLGAEWAKHGIMVNAVAPGPVETEGVLEVWKTPAMIAQAARDVPLQRLGRPEEIAWAVIFVASDQANFMTGETVYVSGGPRVANREDAK